MPGGQVVVKAEVVADADRDGNAGRARREVRADVAQRVRAPAVPIRRRLAAGQRVVPVPGWHARLRAGLISERRDLENALLEPSQVASPGLASSSLHRFTVLTP